MTRVAPHLTALVLIALLGGCLTDSVSQRIRNEAFVGREFEYYIDDAIYAPVFGKYAGMVRESGVDYHDFRFNGLLTPMALNPLIAPDPRHLRLLIPARAQQTSYWGMVEETPRPAGTKMVAILFLRWNSPADPEARVSKEFWGYLQARHPEIRPFFFENAHLVYLNLREFEEFAVHRLPHQPTPPKGWRRVSMSIEIEWRVRKFPRWLFPHALYAAAWPADILTFPAQAILAIVFDIE